MPGTFDNIIRQSMAERPQNVVDDATADKKALYEMWMNEMRGEGYTEEELFDILAKGAMGQTHEGNRTLHRKPNDRDTTTGTR